MDVTDNISTCISCVSSHTVCLQHASRILLQHGLRGQSEQCRGHPHRLEPRNADMEAVTLGTDESPAAAEQPSPATNGGAAANGAESAATEASAESAKRLRNLQKKLRQV